MFYLKPFLAKSKTDYTMFGGKANEILENADENVLETEWSSIAYHGPSSNRDPWEDDT